MSDRYLGEIRMFAGDYPPVGWMICRGQSLSIQEFGSLYTLLGTTYGGDGQNTFKLPDLQGRLPIHPGAEVILGDVGGSEKVTLNKEQLPMHTHVAYANASKDGDTQSPAGAIWAKIPAYSDGITGTPVNMNSQAIGVAGVGVAHNNMMESLTINFIISVTNGEPPR